MAVAGDQHRATRSSAGALGAGAEIARRVATDGHRGMMLWVRGANPARGFTNARRRAAGRLQMAKFGNTELEEIAYGWPSVENF